MKVVFLQPKSFHTWESLNIGYMAAYLKKCIPDIQVEFYTEFFDTPFEIYTGCKDADIIGISATSPQYARGLALARMLKNKDNHIVMGGYHVSNVEYRKGDCIDTIVIGEGEDAMVKICRGLRDPIVKGIAQALPNIPDPDREVMKQKRNIDNCEKVFGRRIISLLGNRGCPYKCVFCSSKSIFPKVRYRTAESIFTEFDKISNEFNADFVKFSDDELGTNRRQMIEFCNLKIRGKNKIPWGCNAVAKNLDRDLLDLMRSAGCAEVWMGVESGDDNLLREMKKPCTIQQIKQAFKDASDAGILRRAYCILGMPGESFETVAKTEALIDEIQPDIVGFTIVAPYPGNAFYKPEMRDIDWNDVDEYGNRFTSSNFLTNEQLCAIQKRLTEKYKKNLTDRQK